MRPLSSVIAPPRPLWALHRPARGFTLVELMITLVVIAVLAALAVPVFFQYMKRATYAELLTHASPVKNALITCLTIERDFAKCSTFSEIGLNQPAPTNLLASVDLVFDGVSDGVTVIRLVPNDYRGIEAGDTCDLRPVVPRRLPLSGSGVASSSDPEIQGWEIVASSPCVTKGYVKP